MDDSKIEDLTNSEIIELIRTDKDRQRRLKMLLFSEDKEFWDTLSTEYEQWEKKQTNSQVKDNKYDQIDLKQLMELEFPPESWIIERILPSEGITMIVGESGSGKSFIALEAVRAVIANQPFLD